MKTEKWKSGTGQNMVVHHRSVCQGRNCPIHNPSDHHMKDFPLHWRDDSGFMERICPHGVGHPDPDDLAFRNERYRSIHGTEPAWTGMHGCDGCCNPEIYEKNMERDLKEARKI